MIKAGEKCAVKVAPDPVQHSLPELIHQVPPEQEAAGDPQESAEHTYHGTFAEHPAAIVRPCLAPIAPMVPITARRSSTASRIVFRAIRKPTRMPDIRFRLKLCEAFASIAGWCGRGGPAVAMPAMTRSIFGLHYQRPVSHNTKAAVA